MRFPCVPPSFTSPGEFLFDDDKPYLWWTASELSELLWIGQGKLQ
jgi:hypothetical protein